MNSEIPRYKLNIFNMCVILMYACMSAYIHAGKCVCIWVCPGDWVCSGGSGHFSEWQNDAKRGCTHKPHPYLRGLISHPRSLLRAMIVWWGTGELTVMNTNAAFIPPNPALSQLSWCSFPCNWQPLLCSTYIKCLITLRITGLSFLRSFSLNWSSTRNVVNRVFGGLSHVSAYVIGWWYELQRR